MTGSLVDSEYEQALDSGQMGRPPSRFDPISSYRNGKGIIQGEDTDGCSTCGGETQKLGSFGIPRKMS